MVTPVRPTQINPSGDRTAHEGTLNRRAGHEPEGGASAGPAEVVSFSRGVAGVHERGERSSYRSAEDAAAAARALKTRLGRQAALAARAQGTAVPERVWNLVSE